MIRKLLLTLAISFPSIVGVSVATTTTANAACVPFTGYALHKSGSYLYLWNPNTGCEGWRYASQAWTCDPYEYYNGFTCPTAGGGGGGGSW